MKGKVDLKEEDSLMCDNGYADDRKPKEMMGVQARGEARPWRTSTHHGLPSASVICGVSS